MSQPVFVGIKNVSGQKCKLQYDGDIKVFDKDEVVIVERAHAAHALKKTILVSDGKRQKHTRLFGEVPLVEAVKLVKAPENPSLGTAKAQVAEELKMEERIVARLQAAGWKPPEKKP